MIYLTHSTITLGQGRPGSNSNDQGTPQSFKTGLTIRCNLVLHPKHLFFGVGGSDASARDTVSIF